MQHLVDMFLDENKRKTAIEKAHRRVMQQRASSDKYRKRRYEKLDRKIEIWVDKEAYKYLKTRLKQARGYRQERTWGEVMGVLISTYKGYKTLEKEYRLYMHKTTKGKKENV